MDCICFYYIHFNKRIGQHFEEMGTVWFMTHQYDFGEAIILLLIIIQTSILWMTFQEATKNVNTSYRAFYTDHSSAVQ
jgi:hypothetical protein